MTSSSRHHQDLQAFGFAVRTLREERRMTLEGLAEAAGLSWRMVIGVEHGQRNPSLITVLALAQGLGLRAEQLIRCAQTRFGLAGG
jgi:transcriptional regulator with XRE-family HTH domain